MKKDGIIYKALTSIEVIGNKLPDPAAIFIFLSILVIILSEILYRFGVSVEYIGFKDGVQTLLTADAKSLISKDGVRVMLSNAMKNYINFAPLGITMIIMLGIGISEGSGLIGTVLKLTVLKAPKRLITSVLVLSGIMSNMASDVGYVVLIPLGATLFLIMGRHPLAGLAATFAGVSGGFSANLLIGTVDILLSGFSTSAAHILDPNYHVTSTSNYYFMAFSAIMLTIVGTLITEKIIEPSLGEYKGEYREEDTDLNVTDIEKKGLFRALISSLIYI